MCPRVGGTFPLMVDVGNLSEGDVVGGDYRIDRALSAGGMGAVYVAKQLSTGKRRALKVMRPELVSDPKSRRRFVDEATAGANIESEHVVEVIAAGVDESSGAPWLAMELLRGDDLEAHIRKNGRMSLTEVVEVLDQVAHALGQAHVLGIIHRDLKPENLFMTRSKRRGATPTIKVLDFGIASFVSGNKTAATVTTAIGSPLWIAPEQTSTGAKLKPATDVWALGLIAFYLLTGRSYWPAANSADFQLNALLAEILALPLVPATQRAEELGVVGVLPAAFDAWFAQCVNRDLDARPPDAQAAIIPLIALASNLSAAGASGATTARPEKPDRRDFVAEPPTERLEESFPALAHPSDTSSGVAPTATLDAFPGRESPQTDSAAPSSSVRRIVLAAAALVSVGGGIVTLSAWAAEWESGGGVTSAEAGEPREASVPAHEGELDGAAGAHPSPPEVESELAIARTLAAEFVERGDGALGIAVVEALARAHDDVDLWTALGDLQHQASQLSNARQSYDRALQLERTNSRALLERALLDVVGDRLDEAPQEIDLAERTARETNQFDTIAALLAVTRGYVALNGAQPTLVNGLYGEYDEVLLDEAARQARLALESDAEFARAHLLLARVAVSRDESDNAERYYRAALRCRAPPSLAVARLALALGVRPSRGGYRRCGGDECCQLAGRYLEVAPAPPGAPRGGTYASLVEHLLEGCE